MWGKFTHESGESLRVGDEPCWVTFDESQHLSEPWFTGLQSDLPESCLCPGEEAGYGGSSRVWAM